MIIYKITNKINNKVYVGQTTRSLKERWNAHLKPNSCRALYRAIEKYGKENFTVEEIDGANSLSELNYLEQHYIWINNSLAPKGYNLLSGGKNHTTSEETRKLISDSKKGSKQTYESNEKRRKTQTGVKRGPMSEEQKKQLSAIRMGKTPWNKGKPMNEKTKLKLSLVKKEQATIEGYINPFLGKKHSEETKQKMRGPRKDFIPHNKGIKKSA